MLDYKDGYCLNQELQGHQTHKETLLDGNMPEVLTFNLNWPDPFPKATDVVKTLLSIKEKFNLKEIYNHERQKPQEYVFKGFICFGHNHYFAFFRRIFQKVGFLQGLEWNRIEQ